MYGCGRREENAMNFQAQLNALYVAFVFLCHCTTAS
jgi:hypothetical protein